MPRGNPGVPKSAETRAKMAAARRAYWERHPDREEFKAKVSAAKRKAGTMGGHPMVYVPERGKMKESRYVMEQEIGRRLETHEHVHHKNHDIADNRLENLEVLEASAHGRLHTQERWDAGQMENLRTLNQSRPRDLLGRFI